MSSFPTSYIPTAGTTVTRGADNALIDGTAFTDFYNQEEGTFLVEFDFDVTKFQQRVLSVNDNTFNNRLFVYHESDGTIFLQARNNGALVSSTKINVNNNSNILALVYDNITQLTLNGIQSPENPLSNLPNFNQLNIGTAFTGLSSLNGHMKRLIYYPKALPDADLQLLTRI